METVTHREMRNRSGELLRRVEAGETVQVTNNGRLAALIVPAAGATLDALIARGDVRSARADTASLRRVKRTRAPMSTAELIEDARGEW